MINNSVLGKLSVQNGDAMSKGEIKKKAFKKEPLKTMKEKGSQKRKKDLEESKETS